VPELEQQLNELGQAVAWPATPRFAIPIPVRREGLAWGWPRLMNSRWAMAAAAVLLIVATLLAYTPSRDAIARWLNLGVTITKVQHPPTPTALPSGTLGSELGL
jgi:hypothetical protein